jgi:CDP-4-dehydro-6-deoxyglucose reductase, E3
MLTVTTIEGRTFEQAEGQSILDAALAQGIGLPYSCRTGRCSSCKVRLVSGRTAALTHELGLTAQEKTEGWILSCAQTAQTHLQIDAEDLTGVTLPVVKTLPCRIIDVQLLAADVMQVRLRLPPSSPLNWLAGQYIDIIGHGGLRRSYSVANACKSEQTLELQIRAVENGAMSDYWFTTAKANDLLRLHGPLGTFFLRECDGLDLVFLATGTGIAPVKAILEDLADTLRLSKPRSVTVYWGGRQASDIYLDISEISTHIRFVPVLSRGADDWAGERGYVQDALLRHERDWTQTVVYACGSDAMIQTAKQVLTQAGLADKRFYSDAFVCSGSIH